MVLLLGSSIIKLTLSNTYVLVSVLQFSISETKYCNKKGITHKIQSKRGKQQFSKCVFTQVNLLKINELL